METGYEYIQKLTDDQLVKMVTETYDEEEIPFVLSEIVKRKHRYRANPFAWQLKEVSSD